MRDHQFWGCLEGKPINCPFMFKPGWIKFPVNSAIKIPNWYSKVYPNHDHGCNSSLWNPTVLSTVDRLTDYSKVGSQTPSRPIRCVQTVTE